MAAFFYTQNQRWQQGIQWLFNQDRGLCDPGLTNTEFADPKPVIKREESGENVLYYEAICMAFIGGMYGD